MESCSEHIGFETPVGFSGDARKVARRRSLEDRHWGSWWGHGWEQPFRGTSVWRAWLRWPSASTCTGQTTSACTSQESLAYPRVFRESLSTVRLPLHESLRSWHIEPNVTHPSLGCRTLGHSQRDKMPPQRQDLLIPDFTSLPLTPQPV